MSIGGQLDHRSTSDVHAAALSSTVSAWLKPTSRRIVVTMLFSLAMCLFMAACVTTDGVDDDYGIAFNLSGKLPGMELSLFVNAALCRAILCLNKAMPAVNWFFVVEYGTVFLTLWAMSYVVVSHVRLGAGLAFLGFVSAFVVPYCIASSNFTMVAGLCTAAGILCLGVYLLNADAGLLTGLLGMLALSMGLCWRFQVFEAGLPFVVLVVAVWVLDSRSERVTVSELLLRSVPLMLSIALCGGLYCYNHATWQRDGWREWAAYNSPRSKLVDFPTPTYNDIAGGLAELGISENDYAMLTSWANADTDVFSTEVVRQVAKLVDSSRCNAAQIPLVAADYAREVPTRFWYFAPIGAIALMQLILASQRRRVGMLLALLGAFCLCVYLALRQRLPFRVETPLWCYALASCLVLGGTEQSGVPGRDAASPRTARVLVYVRDAFVVFGCSVCLAGCAVAFQSRVVDFDANGLLLLFHQDDAPVEGPISSYVASRSDMFFVVAAPQYVALEREHGYRYLPSMSTSQRVMPLGGWDAYAPFRRQQAERLGQTNVVAALLSSHPTLLVADRETAERVLVFLQEHYDASTTCDKVDCVDNAEHVFSWRFRSS